MAVWRVLNKDPMDTPLKSTTLTSRLLSQVPSQGLHQLGTRIAERQPPHPQVLARSLKSISIGPAAYPHTPQIYSLCGGPWVAGLPAMRTQAGFLPDELLAGNQGCTVLCSFWLEPLVLKVNLGASGSVFKEG